MAFSYAFQVNPKFKAVAFERQMGDKMIGPYFAVREWDTKVIRVNPRPPKSQRGHMKGLNRSSEQAIRASIRQAILNMHLTPERANKDEIRYLKTKDILGKRAPSCSLLSGADMVRLLDAFGQHNYAEDLREALRMYEARRPQTSAPKPSPRVPPASSSSATKKRRSTRRVDGVGLRTRRSRAASHPLTRGRQNDDFYGDDDEVMWVNGHRGRGKPQRRRQPRLRQRTRPPKHYSWGSESESDEVSEDSHTHDDDENSHANDQDTQHLRLDLLLSAIDMQRNGRQNTFEAKKSSLVDEKRADRKELLAEADDEDAASDTHAPSCSPRSPSPVVSTHSHAGGAKRRKVSISRSPPSAQLLPEFKGALGMDLRMRARSTLPYVLQLDTVERVKVDPHGAVVSVQSPASTSSRSELKSFATPRAADRLHSPSASPTSMTTDSSAFFVEPDCQVRFKAVVPDDQRVGAMFVDSCSVQRPGSSPSTQALRQSPCASPSIDSRVMNISLSDMAPLRQLPSAAPHATAHAGRSVHNNL